MGYRKPSQTPPDYTGVFVHSDRCQRWQSLIANKMRIEINQWSSSPIRVDPQCRHTPSLYLKRLIISGRFPLWSVVKWILMLSTAKLRVHFSQSWNCLLPATVNRQNPLAVDVANGAQNAVKNIPMSIHSAWIHQMPRFPIRLSQWVEFTPSWYSLKWDWFFESKRP